MENKIAWWGSGPASDFPRRMIGERCVVEAFYQADSPIIDRFRRINLILARRENGGRWLDGGLLPAYREVEDQ